MDEAEDDDLVPLAPAAPREATRLGIGAEDAGRPIERVLVKRLGLAWSHVAKLLRQERVRVGERALARGDAVSRGDEVVIAPPAGGGPRAPLPNRRLRLRVVHEDPDLLVVAKAPGVPVHPGPGHGTDTLLNALVAHDPGLLALGASRGWGLVHRLDQDTSGLLLVARSAAAHEALVAGFKARAVKKEYLALVDGRPPGEAGEVATPVDGKEALTRWALVEARGGASLVRAWPVTGRTHQVRLHLAGLGCPVLGDRQHGRRRAGSLDVPRLALHAHRLELTHPVTGAPLALEEPLPRDLRRAWSSAARLARRAAPGAEPAPE